MADGKSDNRDSEALLKVLTAHYRALVSARSDEHIAGQFFGETALRELEVKDQSIFTALG